MPKSVLDHLSSVSMILLGLISRWIIPLECDISMASNNCFIIENRSFAEKFSIDDFPNSIPFIYSK